MSISSEWLATCGGCECSILDIGEPLLGLLKSVAFVHIPVLMDYKYFGQTGERSELTLPEADVGIVSGAVRNEENREILLEMRRRVKTLVACGSCACYGGIPAIANMSGRDELLEEVYFRDGNTMIPSERIPALEERVYSLDEIVKVDVFLPGCPPTPANLAEALLAIVGGKPIPKTSKSVCDTCHLTRERKEAKIMKRGLLLPAANEWSGKCLLEQGFLCLGPVTRAGCASGTGGPQCLDAGYACRGCYGPVLEGSDQFVDMVNALATTGVDISTIDDPRGTFNQFTGSKTLTKRRK